MLEVPYSITAGSRPATDQRTQLGSRGYWCAIDESQVVNCEVILRARNGDALVATSVDGVAGRVAVCTIPLDWHGWTELGANLLRYAALGVPEVVVWGEEYDAYGDPASHLALSTGSAVVWGFDEFTRLRRLEPPPRLHIIPRPAEASPNEERHEAYDRLLRDGLATGATVLDLAGRPEPGVVQYSVWVGHQGYQLGRRAVQELRGSDFLQRWTTDPYPMRNIVVAAEYFARRHPSLPGLWHPSADRRFVEWLRAFPIYPGMTVTSALAVAQAVYLIDPSRARLGELLAIIERSGGSPGDPAVEISRRGTSLTDEPIDGWLVGILEAEDLSAVEAARILDWIGYLQLIGVGCEDQELAAAVAVKMSGVLTGTTGSAELSPESVANAVLGFSALVEYGATGAAEALNRLTPTLRTWLDEDAPGTRTSLHLRVAHALARAEDVSPLGVEVMTDGLAILRGAPAIRHDREESRTTTLAETNRLLHDRVLDLEQRIGDMTRGYLLGSVVSVLIIIGLPLALAVAAIRELPQLGLGELLIPALVLAVVLFAGLVILSNRLGMIPARLAWIVGWAGALWRRYAPIGEAKTQSESARASTR